MSDTPRTDAAAIRCACSTYVVPSEFARELERENAELLEDAEFWEKYAKQLIVPHYILDPSLRASKFREALAYHPVVDNEVRAALDAARKEAQP